MPEYLIILLGFNLVSFYLHKKYRIKLFENLKQMSIFYLILYPISIVWDNFAIWRGHWIYPGKGLLGIFIGFAPLEDYIFVFTVTYFSLVLYKLVVRNYKY